MIIATKFNHVTNKLAKNMKTNKLKIGFGWFFPDMFGQPQFYWGQLPQGPPRSEHQGRDSWVSAWGVTKTIPGMAGAGTWDDSFNCKIDGSDLWKLYLHIIMCIYIYIHVYIYIIHIIYIYIYIRSHSWFMRQWPIISESLCWTWSRAVQNRAMSVQPHSTRCVKHVSCILPGESLSISWNCVHMFPHHIDAATAEQFKRSSNCRATPGTLCLKIE